MGLDEVLNVGGALLVELVPFQEKSGKAWPFPSSTLHVSTHQEGTIWRLGTGSSPGTKFTAPLSWTLQPAELRIEYLLFKSPSLWVTEAQAEWIISE